MRSLRRALAVLVLTAFTTAGTGCFGSFRLVNKIYDVNKGMGNKFVQELVFLVFVILPVYELASLGDAIIFNTIEFWTGSNPLSMKEGETQERVVQADGKTVKMTFAEQGRSLTIEVTEPGKAPVVTRVRVDEEGAVATDGSGQVLAQAGLDASGSLVVRDGRGEALAVRSAEQLAKMEAAAPAGPAAFLDADAHRADSCALALAH